MSGAEKGSGRRSSRPPRSAARDVRAVLTPELQREVIEQWASRLGWTLRHASERSGAELRARTWAVDEATELTMFEDHILGVHFIHASGDHAEAAARALREVAAFRDGDEVLEEAERAEDPAAKIATLGPVVRALAPRIGDARLLALFRARLGDPNPSVRRAALVSVGMLEWPEIDALLDGFEGDPVLGPGVRLRRWARAKQRSFGDRELDTWNADVLLARASAAIAEEAWDRALGIIDQILSRTPTLGRAYALRAAVWGGNGRIYLAYADALMAAQIGPAHGAHVAAARALADGLKETLVREGRAAAEDDNLSANLVALIAMGRYADVEEIAVGLLGVPSRQEALILFYRGVAAYEEGSVAARAGRRAEALEHLLRAVALDRRWAGKARADEAFKLLWKSAAFKRATRE